MSDWRNDKAAQAAVVMYVALKRLTDAADRSGVVLPEILTLALRDAVDLWPALPHEARSAASAVHGMDAARRGAA